MYATNQIAARYVGIHLMVAGIYTSVPVYLAWASNNFAGHYRRATAIATVLVFTNSGGILSVWLFRATEGPRYQTAYIINLAFLCVYIAAGTALELWYRKQNNTRDAFVREGRMTEYGGGKKMTGDKHVLYRYVC